MSNFACPVKSVFNIYPGFKAKEGAKNRRVEDQEGQKVGRKRDEGGRMREEGG